MSLFITLLGLSLVDSTSIGTLLLPLLMVVVARRVHWSNLAVYFGTVVGLYFAVGLMLLLGAGVAVEAFDDVLDTRPVFWGQLALGVVMVAVSFRMDGNRSDESRLRRMVGGESTPRAMLGLGVAAVGIELVSMVPYLGAIGLLSTSDLGWPARVATLAVYCLVMVLPALAIIGVVSLAGDRLWDRVERFATWIARQTEETVAWIVGIVGFLLAADAVGRLQLF